MLSEEKNTHLRIQNLKKRFGDFDVLKNIDINIEQGQFIAIVGRSGCGKSTLLRLIAGLEQPSEGEILVNGELLKGLSSEIRFLFQEARLLPWKKILENVELGTKNNDKELAISALKEVGLEDRAKEWPSVLSGGQKQRVSLARALASRPRLLLLDEPLGALDALTRIEMQKLIETLWKEQNFTAILVTHDVSEAVTLADRVILINEGSIAMDVKISLARPRIKNNDFAYFEKYILDKVMKKDEDYDNVVSFGKTDYTI
ncbi:sulfonate transport system ATP-binding protein [Clostridium acidisoli DSM 12555]|uniref:Sulfonate transport system ATP-binding protein n=1 Tax=Clostridium acidisoli DSM 12555 TaxID=1121291 RepID=A0A1W1Y010_9CLOT|nr:ATP-binding cassette domain-containing protein [Clostridium acidisoli]SMC29550.1 sulfonate transport system ATP-binding protein [Clostridium acidisoli DSM 12555]